MTIEATITSTGSVDSDETSDEEGFGASAPATASRDVAVIFTGHVGQENRSFRADAALPRPSVVIKRKGILRRRPRLYLRPFVAPFYGPNNMVHLTPRLIAYFEVSIREGPSRPLGVLEQRLTFQQWRNERHGENEEANSRPDCIAIGVATRDFGLHTRMPGWDRASYGYHGDDGSLFHASGHPQRTSYGPTFGSGDTVGCGIDYHQGHVFFTHNGRYLGKAFCIDLSKEWYPVVGMDSNCLAICNFGVSKPFRYDLTKALQIHQAATLKALAATT